MANHTLGYASIEESLARLAQAHRKANSHQLATTTFAALRSTSLFRDGDPACWGEASSSEFLKYCDFKKLESRVWDFMAPRSAENRIVKTGSSSYRVVVADVSQGARWDIPAGSPVQPLSEVLNQPELFVQWKSFLQRQWPSNVFSNWNRGLLYSGLCVFAAPGESCEIDLQIEVEGSPQDFANFHLMLHGGRRSSLRVHEHIQSQNFAGMFLYDRLCAADEDAKLSVSSWEEGSSQSHIVQNTYSLIDKNASWNHMDMTLPSQWTRHNSKASMMDVGANAALYGLYFSDQDFYCDHNTSVEHLSEYTVSKQVYKGILDQTSEAVFHGGVFIAEGARQSSSEQLNKNLLLSNKSEVHSKPELRIFNDDVKAAHGATVGQLDREQLFYLQSRGLSETQAWDYLMQAFVGEVLVEIDESERAFFKAPVRQALEGLRRSHGL